MPVILTHKMPTNKKALGLSSIDDERQTSRALIPVSASWHIDWEMTVGGVTV